MEEREEEAVPMRLTDAKDELNLAEFPLCAIADRLPPGQKSLSFEDQVWDAARGEMIVRQLTITGSNEYGLPTALDDEVLLGLIQFSKFQHFADRKVYFSRFQLLRLLGWRDGSNNYARIDTSLNRWVGVTLYYKNAWWNRVEKVWANEKFHVLDNVTIFDREKAPKQYRAGGQSHLPLSTFVWNDVLFRSFQSGNVKSIDFDFFKRLDSSVAKRLYRFLDKRFYHRPHWEFDLREICWEHIGLSRNYADAANLKRKLKTGIHELERQGFLVSMRDDERFRKLITGEWRVTFDKAIVAKSNERQQSLPTPDSSALCDALIRRGVSPSAAAEVVLAHPAEHLRSQLEVFDWLVGQDHASVSKNPAGFLVASIRSEYSRPKGFVSEAERAKRAVQADTRKKREDAKHQEAMLQAERQRLSREEAIHRYWQSCSEGERQRLELEALAGATAIERDVMERGGSFAAATRQSILDAFALAELLQGT